MFRFLRVGEEVNFAVLKLQQAHESGSQCGVLEATYTVNSLNTQ